MVASGFGKVSWNGGFPYLSEITGGIIISPIGCAIGVTASSINKLPPIWILGFNLKVRWSYYDMMPQLYAFITHPNRKYMNDRSTCSSVDSLVVSTYLGKPPFWWFKSPFLLFDRCWWYQLKLQLDERQQANTAEFQAIQVHLVDRWKWLDSEPSKSNFGETPLKPPFPQTK